MIQGNLATEDGPSIAVPPIMASHEIPDRDRDCDEWYQSPILKKVMPVITKTRVLKRKEAKTQFWSRKGKDGLNVKEKWVRWEDPSQRFDAISLGAVCDTVSIFLFIPSQSICNVS